MTTKKIIFPVMAAMIAVGAAFATSEKAKEKSVSKPVLATFYVVTESEDSNSYLVTSEQDPNCGADGARVCEITSSASPDANNRIQKTQASASGWKP